MKKLMIAAAIVCAATISQAASISWAAASYNYVTKDGTVQTATTADAGKFVLVYLGNGTANWDAASVVNEGSVSYGASKSGGKYAKASGSYSWTTDIEGVGVVQNGDIFGVMFKDAEGNLSKLQTVGGADIDPTFTVSGLNASYSKDFTFASSNYTVASVPEPTSALMLLLGVAGLALRRRRA